jgi:hypothetical protein
MKRIFLWISIISIVSIGLSGCTGDSDLIMESKPGGELISTPRQYLDEDPITSFYFPSSIMLNGYKVSFEGRTYENDQTIFLYKVKGEDAEHALSHFFLELPECAPVLDSYTPAGGIININPLIEIYGIKWEVSLGTSEYRYYSITFPGDIPLGFIRASVKASTVSDVGYVTGPCNAYEISGTVYVDADSNGTQGETDETGIIDVTVKIEDDKGNYATAITDANGDYSFLVPPGTFTLSIDPETPDDDFNENLATSFDPTGPTSLVVTVGPDSPDNDFGFDPRTEEIVFEIEQGTLLTNGEPPKFWKKQVRAAMLGNSANTEFDAATMARFIEEIEELFLPDPFQFTPGNEFQEALDILSTNSKDPLEILKKELLAAEFNEVSGKGLVEAAELQSVMISWAESVFVGATPVMLSTTTFDHYISLMASTETRIPQAIDFLMNMNGSTGGGSGGGG